MGKEFLNQMFAAKRNTGEKIFVPYIVAGDGGLDKLEERLHFLKECGATAVELGIPFSDPVADGPTIQAAGKRAIENGTSLSAVLETLANFKKAPRLPIIIMTYLNPIYSYGIDHFAQDCQEFGVDGVIIPDLPMEEEELVAESLQKHSIAFIRLAALTSPKSRLEKLAARSEGFLYAVSVTGTTGARSTHRDEVKSYLQWLKENSSVPVLAGFGISSSEQAIELGSYCDGVIVGSMIVELFHEGKLDEIKSLITQSGNRSKHLTIGTAN